MENETIHSQGQSEKKTSYLEIPARLGVSLSLSYLGTRSLCTSSHHLMVFQDEFLSNIS